MKKPTKYDFALAKGYDKLSDASRKMEGIINSINELRFVLTFLPEDGGRAKDIKQDLKVLTYDMEFYMAQYDVIRDQISHILSHPDTVLSTTEDFRRKVPASALEIVRGYYYK